MKTALSIAGSDSCGGAGIQADIKTMTMNGVYAMSAITALTAQNTIGVRSILEATPEFLAQQIDAVFEERYLNDGDGIKQLLSLFMRNRRDDNLKDMILELHKFFESEAYPRLYANQVVDIYSIDGYQKIKNAFSAYRQTLK